MSTRRRGITNGVRRMLPFSVMAGPFGLVYGATATASGIETFPAILASILVFAGASQIALVELIDDGASWAIAIATGLVINLRLALYSASLAPSFRDFPTRWRFPLATLVVDQTAVISILEFEEEDDPEYRRWFFLGGGVWLITPWITGSVIGVLFAGDIPSNWQIGFAVPLMFTALLIPTVQNLPKLAAAIIGGGVTVSTTWLPSGSNIMLGAICGITAGTMLAERAARAAERAPA
ncbi:MAG: putative branched-subunit amino acid permease [Candidatus Aldehydirespiratoraceae bacterium]|jgi:predicted branched-subunit amino acid permease